MVEVLKTECGFLLECIESARNNVGSDFPMIVGLALDHGFPGGRELDENNRNCKKAQTDRHRYIASQTWKL